MAAMKVSTRNKAENEINIPPFSPELFSLHLNNIVLEN